MSNETPRRSVFARAVDALHRLIHPGYVEERQRLDAIVRTLRKVESKQREQFSDVRTLLTRVWDRVETQATQRDFRGVDYRLTQVTGAVRRQYHMTAKALKFAEWQEEQRVFERRLKRRLARIASESGPVIVGPWTGEVGFELLYWIPFVTSALREAAVSPDRIVIVSRGGPAPWYSHLGGRYIDILSHFSPDQFREATVVEKKQKGMGHFDRHIVRAVLRTIGTRRASILHPGLMYPLFQPFWKQRENVGRVENHTTSQLLDRAAVPTVPRRLPADYVAVRFYFSACFPDVPANRAFVDSVISALSDAGHVVLLNTGINVDDHRDYVPARREHIHTVDDLMTPEGNLAIQTAVIAGARAFVGTYGGYSYLAPLYGVRSLAFYSDPDAFFAHHLDFAQRVFRRLGAASLVPLDVRDVDLLRLALTSSEGAAAGPVARS
jgi:hypothetical protein